MDDAPSAIAEQTRFRLPFRYTLLSVFLTVLAASTFAVGWSMHRVASYTARDLSDQVLEQASLRIEQNVQSFLEKARLVASANRNLLLNRDLEHLDLFQLGQSYYEQIREYENFSYILMGREDGSTTSATRKRDGTVSFNVLARNPDQSVTGGDFVYKDGQRVKIGDYYKNTEGGPYDPRTRPWYLAARQAMRPVWTDSYVFINAPPHDPETVGLSYCVPFIDRAGRFLGAGTVDFDSLFICKFLQQLKLGENGLAFLVEYPREGSPRMIAHPDPSNLLQLTQTPDSKRKVELLPLSRVPDARVRALVGVLPPVGELTGGSDFRRLDFTLSGEDFFAACKPIGGMRGELYPRWLVCVVVPRRNFMQGVDAMATRSFFVALLCFLVAVLACMVVANRISRPLRQLVDDTRRISKFHLDKAEDNGSFILEIDQLDQSIEEMKAGLRSFQKYVPADLVRSLIESGQEARLGGEQRVMTVFFSDLKNFTTISEQLEPKQLVAQLGEYMAVMTEVIASCNGTLDKYIGDSLMAFWGAPQYQDAHAYQACLAAVRCQEAIKVLHRQWTAAGKPLFSQRIGISTGGIIVGNMGSEKRMNYTVLGDDVNLASRLESLNKFYGTDIIISGRTFYKAEELLVTRPLDRVAVKGKAIGLLVYELIGVRGEVPESLVHSAKVYAAALEAYFKRDWDEAEKGFQTFLNDRPDDLASTRLLERIALFRQEPPPADWTGIFAMTEK